MKYIDIKGLMKKARVMLRRVSPKWFRSAKRVYMKGNKGRALDAEANGQWYLRRDLLDRLPEYKTLIKKLRKADPYAYKLYRKLGAVLVPPLARHKDTISDCKLVSCVDNLPTFGSVAMLYEDLGPKIKQDLDLISLKFVCFQKLKHVPAGVTPSKGVVYCMSLYYAYAHSSKEAMSRFYIAVHPDGTTTALKERHVEMQQLPKRGGQVPHVSHQLPRCLTQPISEYDHKPDDPQEAARQVFVRYINTYYQGSNGVRVAVSKGSLTAIFTIDMLRSPYFFSDRDPVVIDGIKKRIFHYVRPHVRTYLTGATTNIRSHFRGLNKFSWLGYNVRITVPGKTALDILTFTPDAYNAEDIEGLRGYMDETQLANKLTPHVNG